MPLIKPVLEAQIFGAFQQMFNNMTDQPIIAQKKLAKKLASAIDQYIKSATIITPPGTLVTAVNAPGQVVIGAGGGVPGPMVGSTTSPGAVTGATSAPTAPAMIS